MKIRQSARRDIATEKVTMSLVVYVAKRMGKTRADKEGGKYYPSEFEL